jgi:hypothetical protein
VSEGKYYVIIRVVEASENNLDDLCMLCVPLDRKNDPVFMKGVELKKIWARGMLERWGSVAKIAYVGDSPAGLIQYTPVPDEMVVRIICIFCTIQGALEEGYWKKAPN